MQQFKGVKVFDGYACNEIKVLKQNVKITKREFISFDAEYQIFNQARNKEIEKLDQLFVTTLNKLGKSKAALFETHKLMAQDLDYEDTIKKYLNQHMIAEDAVTSATNEMASIFSSMDDEYMKDRAADVKEVGHGILDFILGNDHDAKLKKPTIIVCDDLPSNTLMQFDREKIVGLVLVKGNINSHVSILARSLQIPTICDVKDLDINTLQSGTLAILDALSGNFISQPTEEIIQKHAKFFLEYNKKVAELKSFKGKETITIDGFKTKLYANIANSKEVTAVLNNDAEGIGLFRSEFLYLQAKNYPTEEEQFAFYKQAVEGMQGKETIIRTFDIGADKKVDYFNLPHEDNPALGYRSIRICMNRPEMFKTQLRALYRASIYGKLSIMVPMIISVNEVKFTKDLITEVWKELDEQNIPYKKDVKVGIMIETPAAAVISDELAKHVDFFSIGTNDLSQYTLACDRLNSTLDKTFDAHHKAILRLIALTAKNAHKAGIEIGMCGELARDKDLLPLWIALKFDELSCSSAYILELRQAISKIDSSKIDLSKYLD